MGNPNTCGYANKCNMPDACEWCDYAFDKMEGGKMKFKIHEIDKRKLNRAKRIEWELINNMREVYQKNNLVRISVHPACRGSWRIGYTYSGKYCVSILFNIGWKNVAKFYLIPTRKNIKKLIEKITPALQNELIRRQALALYRNSGLIPKRIAKAHDNKLLAKHPNRSLDADYWNEAIKLGVQYAVNHGKCPTCGHIGFIENVYGLDCGAKCGQYWDDTNFKWGLKTE